MGTTGDNAYEKYAWVIFFVFGLLAVLAGITILAGLLPNPPSPESTTGLTLDQIAARVPGIGGYVGGLARQLGNFMVAMGVMLAGIAAVPYRRGERWAWYVCWIMPVNLVLQLANGLATGRFLWQLDAASLLVVLAALFLPYRRFFPGGRIAS